MPEADVEVSSPELKDEAASAGNPDELSPQAMTSADAHRAVIREVASWEGVRVHEHRFGGVEFRLGRRELGHLHPSFADLPFPRRVRDELVASGRAKPHHILPASGWVSVPMRTAAEVAGVIDLFRQSYRRVEMSPGAKRAGEEAEQPESMTKRGGTRP